MMRFWQSHVCALSNRYPYFKMISDQQANMIVFTMKFHPCGFHVCAQVTAAPLRLGALRCGVQFPGFRADILAGDATEDQAVYDSDAA